MSKQWIVIGKLLSPHGVKGYVKVYPYSDFPERCKELHEVALENLQGRRVPAQVEKAAVYGRFWLVKFKGVESPEQAAELNGLLMLIPPEERLPLPPGSYYYDQLVGLAVYTTAGERLGQIIDIVSTGGHDLYVVNKQGENGEFLLPAVKEFVKEINLDRGDIRVDLLPGLTEL